MFDLSFVPETMRQPAYFAIFNMAWTWIAGEVTDNLSQVDRLWTFAPPLYSAYFTFAPAFSWAPLAVRSAGIQDRALLMFGLQVLWSWRLTYNAIRRGITNLAEEDYRWQPLRESMNIVLFKVFHLGFVAIIQNILLFMLAWPVHSVLVEKHTPLGLSDYILAGTSLLILALEFTSDNQQWSYQNFKRSGLVNPNEWPGARIAWTESDRARGFVTRGLWAWSRHPNFACEQSFWIVQTLFPILAAPRLPKLALATITPFWGPALLPAVSIVGLFISSTLFTEKLTGLKYPHYTEYKRRVGMFSPSETVLKGLFLMVTGQKAAVDQSLWGPGKVLKVE